MFRTELSVRCRRKSNFHLLCREFDLKFIRSYVQIYVCLQVICFEDYCARRKEMLALYTDRKINVRVWENVASPFMTGIFRPTLILPKTELSSEQLDNMLRHEMTHFNS